MNIWPPIVMLILLSSGLFIAMSEHGKPRRPVNFWVHLFSLVITLLLLQWGGYFAPLFAR